MVLRHQEIVGKRGVRRVKSLHARQLAGLVDETIGNGIGERAADVVPEEYHLASQRIDFRMRREASCLERTAEVPIASRGDRLRIKFERQMGLLAGENLAGVNDDARVGDAAIL